MTNKQKIKAIEDAIFKKATGFTVTTVVTEFDIDKKGEESKVKKKVTVKQLEPDIGAAKIILNNNNNSTKDDYSNMSETQLTQQRDNLLRELMDSDINELFNKPKPK